MCRKVPCSTCGKASWAGCGQHIDAALSGTSMDDRCKGWRTGVCPEAKRRADVPVSVKAQVTGDVVFAASIEKPSLLKRMFSRVYKPFGKGQIEANKAEQEPTKVLAKKLEI